MWKSVAAPCERSRGMAMGFSRRWNVAAALSLAIDANDAASSRSYLPGTFRDHFPIELKQPRENSLPRVPLGNASMERLAPALQTSTCGLANSRSERFR